MSGDLLRISRKLDGVAESATLKLNALLVSLKAQGKDVVNLTAGEPDFPADPEAKAAMIAAIEADQSKYTPVAGIPELRQRIAAKTNLQQPGVKPWAASNVLVTNGGKQAIFNSFLALLDPGDEVLIASPYWLSYPDMARIAGGTPRIIKTEAPDGFKLRPEQLRAAMGPRTRIFVVNSPSNPAGITYSREELRALGETIREHSRGPDTWILSDEIYDAIVFEPNVFTSFLGACPELREQTITVNGMSKSGAMTGWRVGWSVAPQSITQAMSTIQGQSTSGINGPAQRAALASLGVPATRLEARRETYRKRRDLALRILGACPEIELVSPGGAFYLFIGLGKVLKNGQDMNAWCEKLLETSGVALVPGGPFGEDRFARLSFATDEKSLQEGCNRIVQHVNARS